MRAGLCGMLVAAIGCTSGTEGKRPDAGEGDASTSDGGAPLDGGSVDAAPSLCRATPELVECPERMRMFTVAGVERRLRYQLPVTPPPAGGWPVVFLFQGSYYRVRFAAARDAVIGQYHETSLIKELLDRGFAVLAPEVRQDGNTYWDTNIPPWTTSWTAAPDHLFMLALFDAIGSGELGGLSSQRLFAAGISSGGYMSSRMAVSYPGRFRALAIHSASYATCAASNCVVPRDLPLDHPPTLFLHGTSDTVVPLSTMLPYHDRLIELGREAHKIEIAGGEHAWFAESPGAVAAFFAAR